MRSRTSSRAASPVSSRASSWEGGRATRHVLRLTRSLWLVLVAVCLLGMVSR